MTNEEKISRLFEQTMANCRFYESEGKSLALLNEIGVLRGLAYALEAFGECPHSDQFLHFIELQETLKAN